VIKAAPAASWGRARRGDAVEPEVDVDVVGQQRDLDAAAQSAEA
jgi:hypothetical protein